MDDGVDLFFGKDFPDKGGVGNVAFDEAIVGIFLDAGQIAGIAGIGELIEIDDFVIGIVLQRVADKVGPDKPASAGDQ